MAKFTLTFETDGFHGYALEAETARILAKVASQVPEGGEGRRIMDANGNDIGVWTLEVCDCSEEYGPCEMHGETLVLREGASLRTADELNVVYIDDALSIDPHALSAYGRETYNEATAALAEASWIDDADLAEALTDLTHQVENYISDTDLQTYRDDGYRIVRITGGPLLED